MDIKNDTVVTMHYTLTGPDGSVIDSSKEGQPLSYLQGHGKIVPGLEKEMAGKAEGEKLTVTIPPAEGYGEHNPDLVIKASMAQFPEDSEVTPGMRFQADTPQGPRIAQIVAVDGEEVTVDTNHPLAGIPLKFDIEVVSVREAHPTEIDHGHVHHDGNHDHD